MLEFIITIKYAVGIRDNINLVQFDLWLKPVSLGNLILYLTIFDLHNYINSVLCGFRAINFDEWFIIGSSSLKAITLPFHKSINLE